MAFNVQNVTKQWRHKHTTCMTSQAWRHSYDVTHISWTRCLASYITSHLMLMTSYTYHVTWRDIPHVHDVSTWRQRYNKNMNLGAFCLLICLWFQAIKDIHLFGIVAALVIVDIFYLSLWFGYDPLKATKLNFTLQVIHSFVHSFIHSPIGLFIHFFYSFIYLLICSCIHSFIHSFIYFSYFYFKSSI